MNDKKTKRYIFDYITSNKTSIDIEKSLELAKSKERKQYIERSLTPDERVLNCVLSKLDC